ncbi:phenylalanyl-tRNA synthetase beta chain [Phycisphaerales bacterium]|nr:phenylalanyl-tRNA synthetase beta chain [Phycisphaerales bacterium]
MLISRHWLLQYLDPRPENERLEEALIESGFPIEARETLPGGNARLDVEITSNRGDCLSHLGLAREVAAKLGLRFVPPACPELSPGAGSVGQAIALENRVPQACPRFTLRVIRGAKIGPSPSWLREALESVGQRSINNVVDVTNFISFEWGNPCHAFDLAKLAGGKLVIRHAAAGEMLTTLDGKSRKLAADELVVADGVRAQSLAGIMGGAESEVSGATTGVVIEMATWDPVAVRRAARRHQLRTDASHRFERLVDPRTIDAAAARCAALILEAAGGQLCEGMLEEGRPREQPTRIRFRPSRCRALLGVDLTTQAMVGAMRRLEIDVGPVGRAGEELVCTAPVFRPDLTREADLIEEVARMVGLSAVPVHGTMPVAVAAPQKSENARRELAGVLAGLGFYECVSFSFTDRKSAAAFMPAGLTTIEISDDRRGEEPALRPSVLAGLLGCRRKNQHGLVQAQGGVRLYEIAAVFGEQRMPGGAPTTIENVNAALLLDVPIKGRAAGISELQHGVRLMRGAIETLVRAMAGPDAALEITPSEPHAPAFDERAFARVALDGRALGYLGLIAGATQQAFDLAAPLVGAELNLAALLAGFPPRSFVHTLPLFPGIERDLSLVVAETTRWAAVERAVRANAAPPFEGVSFVGTFRGAQVGKGRKSVTLRLSYRDPARTLRHEEVDGPVETLVGVLRRELGAELRA